MMMTMVKIDKMRVRIDEDESKGEDEAEDR